MSDNASNSNAAARAQRMQRQAEHRAIVQATMQAKRSGKLPARQAATPGADALTAVAVLVVVIGMLVLVLRQAG